MKFRALSRAEQRERGPGTPLRSGAELSKECGVTIAQMRGLLSRLKGPKPKIQHATGSWYEPVEFRKWWKSLTVRKDREESGHENR